MLHLLRRRQCCVSLCVWPAYACAVSAARVARRMLRAHVSLSFFLACWRAGCRSWACLAQGVWVSGAGHNHRRIAGHLKQRYRFFERHRNGAAVLTIRSSGRRSIACVLPNGAAGAAYLKR